MKPTIGRIVIYRTTEAQRKAMESSYALRRSGCNVSYQLPAVVVAVWSDTCVNLKVLLDGVGDIWVTTANEGVKEGDWHWPERVQI